jgi:hypothetical protein
MHPLVFLLKTLGFSHRMATLITGWYYLLPVAACIWFILWKLPQIQAYWKAVGEIYRSNLLTRLDELLLRFKSIQANLSRQKQEQSTIQANLSRQKQEQSTIKKRSLSSETTSAT